MIIKPPIFLFNIDSKQSPAQAMAVKKTQNHAYKLRSNEPEVQYWM